MRKRHNRCAARLLLAAVVLAASCNADDVVEGGEIRVLNGKKLFSSIHKSDALQGWPDGVKSQCGPENWGSWRPQEGMIGKVLKIWKPQVLLQLDGHYVVMDIGALANHETMLTKLNAIQGEVGEFLEQMKDIDAAAEWETLQELWKDDRFPLFGKDYSFRTLLVGYICSLVLLLVATYYLTPAGGANIPQIKARMEQIYKEHNPANIAKIPQILQKWKGKEQFIISALKKKYDIVEESDIKAELDSAERELDDAMEKVQNMEEEEDGDDGGEDEEEEEES